MTIQEQLQKAMIEALKAGNSIRKDNIKFLIGQFQTASKNKEKTVTDEEAIKIIKNIVKSVKEVTIPNLIQNPIQGIGLDTPNPKLTEAYDFIELCESILPQMATEEEIRNFLKTVDFSQFKNKMQAIGVVTKHFNGNVDGNLVKSIVMEM
jgi:uncharacterized protein YqeY